MLEAKDMARTKDVSQSFTSCGAFTFSLEFGKALRMAGALVNCSSRLYQYDFVNSDGFDEAFRGRGVGSNSYKEKIEPGHSENYCPGALFHQKFPSLEIPLDLMSSFAERRTSTHRNINLTLRSLPAYSKSEVFFSKESRCPGPVERGKT